MQSQQRRVPSPVAPAETSGQSPNQVETLKSADASLSLSSGGAVWPPEARIPGRLLLTRTELAFQPSAGDQHTRRWSIRELDPTRLRAVEAEVVPGFLRGLFRAIERDEFPLIAYLVVFILWGPFYLFHRAMLKLRNESREVLWVHGTAIFVRHASEWLSDMLDYRPRPKRVSRALVGRIKTKMLEAARRAGYVVKENPKTTRIQLNDQLRIIMKSRAMTVERVRPDESGNTGWQRVQALNLAGLDAFSDDALMKWLQKAPRRKAGDAYVAEESVTDWIHAPRD